MRWSCGTAVPGVLTSAAGTAATAAAPSATNVPRLAVALLPSCRWLPPARPAGDESPPAPGHACPCSSGRFRRRQAPHTHGHQRPQPPRSALGTVHGGCRRVGHHERPPPGRVETTPPPAASREPGEQTSDPCHHRLPAQNVQISANQRLDRPRERQPRRRLRGAPDADSPSLNATTRTSQRCWPNGCRLCRYRKPCRVTVRRAHNIQMRTFTRSTPMHEHTVGYLARRSLLRKTWLLVKGTSVRLIFHQVLDSAAPAVTRPV
jgi:hypothetical protein